MRVVRPLLLALSGATIAASEDVATTASSCQEGQCAEGFGDESSMLQMRGAKEAHVQEHDQQMEDEHPERKGAISMFSGGWAKSGKPSKKQLDASLASFRAMEPVELTLPEVLTKNGAGEYELTLQEAELPTPFIGGSYMTRAYNGKIPGQTIVAKPGELLKIRLKNGLAPGPGTEACSTKDKLGFFLNPDAICELNTTNLHVHGLHVSPEGNADNIFVTLHSGEEHLYEIQIPENHMGGTHWYHPHIHHATASQAGGGAHGVIVIEDPAGSVPQVVEDMPHMVMMLSLVNPAKEMRLEAWGLATTQGIVAEQVLWKNTLYPDWQWDFVSGFLIDEMGNVISEGLGLPPYLAVNGQYRPKLTVTEGKWYRMRFVLASLEQLVEIREAELEEEDGQAHCEYQLLSKDGVFLLEAPRSIDKIYLASGSRADVAVRCKCEPGLQYPWETKRPCQATWNFTASWSPMGTLRKSIELESFTDTLLTIQTNSPTEVAEEPDIQPFKVRRPCYLVDMREADVQKSNKHYVNLPQLYPMKVSVDGVGHVWGHKPTPPLAQVPVGQIQEWHVVGVMYHPYHVHVNPYQIVSMRNDPWYKVGDFHDTIFPTQAGVATLRTNIDKFTGHMIAHCHILEHEDTGMMGWWNITGTEGTSYAAAKSLDPTCYEGPFPDTNFWGVY
mmetsp:Transcript_52177/g.111064  ORF Transcript_52177/g.111064 Transcript_52177/m.111064 type:complete len:671 (-) Transcript_52177:314-2326(-)|eukprot:CAMPEP_0206440652 /NCGR_PEP_ID=MMETSP0324_2-20121206/12864_1 /ASSEMBLY_ACC=CAM_ASM_000836 /TAXON_ID=2866 /ORGANISM="Crypthecodinium cohnii, Strain Seligo" /LENGTH=670 /DNA_ID=CAMNT_0053908365 /DNA_START=137 /DNA_END=2149 /DNA_ORIENTATION=-